MPDHDLANRPADPQGAPATQAASDLGSRLPPGWRRCPVHLPVALPEALRPGEALTCPLCAWAARAASYGRQRAEFLPMADLAATRLGRVTPRPVSRLLAAGEGGVETAIPRRPAEVPTQ
jgi:hypothetical protein